MIPKFCKEVVWIGPLLSEPRLEEMVRSGECATASANLAEWNFIKAILLDSEARVSVLSALRTIEFPINSKLFYPSKELETYYSDKVKLLNVGYCNLFGISHISREMKLVREANRWAGIFQKDCFVQVVIYSMHLPFMRAAAEFKRMHSNCSVTMIVPDLPLNMNISTPLRKFLKQIDWSNIKKEMKHIDRFILYTPQMADYLNLPLGKYAVCEGIANLDLLSSERPFVERGSKRCVYAGSLDSEYKIENLVYAFAKLGRKDASLEIYGSGSGEKLIADACEKFDNITFGGFRNNCEIIEIEKQASFVINPRPIDLSCVEYSCPSKTLESMAIGVPLITTKLAGIPSSYYGHLLTFPDSSIDGLMEGLSAALNMDSCDLYKLGQSARDFIAARASEIANELLDGI